MRLTVGAHVVHWVATRTHEYGEYRSDIGIGWERDGELVAGVVYCDWNGPNCMAHIASDGTRRWATRKFLWAIFDYPFNQAKSSRITACVGEGNNASRRFIEHLGFTLEARLEKAHPTGDLLVYRMLKRDCKFLNWSENAERRLQEKRAA